MDALPGPSTATGVPNFVIQKFRVPVFLLPIYQAAGIQYGVRWEVLAAINEIETDYGRNLNVSSAGAVGWMQFMPSTWRRYGVDANKDGRKDPFNPVDAIFAAARYLKAAGYEKDARRSIFAYNHAGWYVDSVMLRARLIAGVPADLVGLADRPDRGPLPRRRPRPLRRRPQGPALQEGQGRPERRQRGRVLATTATTWTSTPSEGAPVVATNDGQVKKIGSSPTLGRYVIVQDVYGNRYTYAGPGLHRQVLRRAQGRGGHRGHLLQGAEGQPGPPRPQAHPGRLRRAPAQAGQAPPARAAQPGRPGAPRPPASSSACSPTPRCPMARESGGSDQLLDMQSRSGISTYDGYAHPVPLDRRHFRLRRLRAGAHVMAGAPLGTVGQHDAGKAAHLRFAIRPAGKGAPTIDPKPILDGWKLLEATSIYRASGKNALAATATAACPSARCC